MYVRNRDERLRKIYCIYSSRWGEGKAGGLREKEDMKKSMVYIVGNGCQSCLG